MSEIVSSFLASAEVIDGASGLGSSLKTGGASMDGMGRADGPAHARSGRVHRHRGFRRARAAEHHLHLQAVGRLRPSTRLLNVLAANATE
jgi:hypothetical protein